jgi:hypothetical protein
VSPEEPLVGSEVPLVPSDPESAFSHAPARIAPMVSIAIEERVRFLIKRFSKDLERSDTLPSPLAAVGSSDRISRVKVALVELLPR